MSRFSGFGPCAALVGITLAVFAPARSTYAAQLVWEVPAGCPSQDTVELRIRDALGIPLARARNVRFFCKVTPAPKGGVRLELQVAGAEQPAHQTPRIFEASTCDQVAETAAVAIALALGANQERDPETSTTTSNSTPLTADTPSNETEIPIADSRSNGATLSDSSAPSVPTVVAPGKPPNAPAPTTTLEHSPLWLATELGPVVDWGSLPQIAPGIDASVAFGYRALSLRISGCTLMERSATIADGTGGRFSLTAGALSFCGNTPREQAHATVCAGFELGQQVGEGIGPLKLRRKGTALWSTPRADITLRSAPAWFGLRYFAGLGAGAPLTRPSFTLGGDTEVHQAARLVGRLVLGLEINWP